MQIQYIVLIYRIDFSLHREKESLAVYSLIVKCLSIDTKTFTRLWIQVPIADKIHQKDFQSRKKIPI